MSKTEKVYRYGERGSGIKTKNGMPQYYEKIIRKCLDENKLFEDPEFPCQDSSIRMKDQKGEIVWKRPHDIVKKPRFFVEGVSRDDVRQVGIGNCWFVAALASLTQRKVLFDRVVPRGQSFKEGLYAGVFHFVFWNNNRWVDVVIDDRLPMLKEGGGYLGIKSGDENEFWSALVEKAYAKLNRSYGVLEGGTGTDALTDFTGGIPEQILGVPLPKDTWRIMKRALERKSIMTASFVTLSGGDDDDAVREIKRNDGLFAGHEYSVTGIAQFSLEDTENLVRLIRLRNPWGRSEYNGPWSDVSKEWKKVSQAKLEELGVIVRDDGEFWIEEEYFRNRFIMVDMCHLEPGSVEEDPDTKRWETATFEGSWVTGVSAGGSDSGNDKYGTNPQYLVTLREPDSEDQDGECSMLLSLRQKTEREKGWRSIGFAIYEVEDPESCEKPLPIQYLRDHTFVEVVEPLPHRDLTKRLRVLPATYCIVVYTEEADTDCGFVLRVFTEQKSECRECDGSNVCVPKPLETNEGGDTKEEEIPQYFNKIYKEVTGHKEAASPGDLHVILRKVFQEENLQVDFPLDVCRTMVALLDKNLTGELDENEIVALYAYLKKCQRAYQKYDQSCTGFLTTYQLRNALRLAGCYVNLHVLKALVMRYGRQNKIGFVDYMACAVKVACMEEIYSEHANEDRNVVLSLNEWMEATMYC
ncbi:calpain-A-like [Ornithodoros turicata]|uniref:calpain-A-like n=1 Tax=Ornithodoros turicata TaxID=34597 RepID=UPI0031391BF8